MGNLIPDVCAPLQFRDRMDYWSALMMIFWRKRIQPQIIQAYLFYIQNVSCVCLTTTSLVLKKFFAYYHAIFSRRLNKFNDLVTGVGHNIESGKDFTVDGLSGFSKKKKKKRRHRWVSHPNLFFFFFVVVVFFFLVRWTIFFSLYYFFFLLLFIYLSFALHRIFSPFPKRRH